MNEAVESKWVFTHEITADPRCQPRAEMDQAVVDEYAETMADGGIFPPVEVFYDGATHWLADGFHRYFAAQGAGLTQLEAIVQPGDVWAAIERSCIVNGEHGLRRSNGDKRRAVQAMFGVMEHRGENWSDAEIARRCGVGWDLAKAVRLSIFRIPEDATTRLVTRGGRTFEMDTSRIGVRLPAPVIETWQMPVPTSASTGSPPEMSPEIAEKLVSFERAVGRRLVVGETLADCGKRLSMARGELGELVRDLGTEVVRGEVTASAELSHRWWELVELAAGIAAFARDVVSTEREEA